VFKGKHACSMNEPPQWGGHGMTRPSCLGAFDPSGAGAHGESTMGSHGLCEMGWG
jgi:hypothetical protein